MANKKKLFWVAPAYKKDDKIIKLPQGPAPDKDAAGFLGQDGKFYGRKQIEKTRENGEKKLVWIPVGTPEQSKQVTFATIQACIRGEAVTKKGKPKKAEPTVKRGRGRPKKIQVTKSYDVLPVAPITDAINDEFTDFIMDKIKKEYGVSIPKNNKARASAQALYSRLRTIERDRMQAISELKKL